MKASSIATGTTLPSEGSPAGRHGAAQQRGSGLILIVDDNADTSALYSLYFVQRGFTVRVASDGLSGIGAVQQFRPDVVIMDLSMPGLDGMTATKRLKRDARTRHIPILVLTACPERAIGGGALESGADGFLTKPCLPEDLEEHVRRLLASRRRRTS